MNVLVFGAGAVGSVFGGFLTRLGHDVSLVGRPAHMDAIRKQGLVITGIWGDYRIKALEAYTRLADVPAKKPFDLILLTVKSYDTAKAVEEILPFVSPTTTVVSLQNGLGNLEAITARVRPEQVQLGRVIFGAETTPGIVKITVSADAVIVGPVPGVSPIISQVQVAHVFSTAKVETRGVTDILPVIWAKVIYNCALNARCSLDGIPYGKILESEATRNEMEAVVRECYAVGKAAGVKLDPLDVDAYLKLLAGTLIPRTKEHFPSMLQDLQAGKRTEIEALNGAICRLGEKTGIPTPANRLLFDAIRQKDRNF